MLLSSDRRNNLASLQEQVVVIPPERRCVGFVLVRLHRRKNSILACLFQTTHTKKPWAALTPRPTALSQVRNGRKKKNRRRDHFVSPTACRWDVLLRYLQLRVNVFPKKGHSTTLGDTKRMNVKSTPTRAKAPPFGALHCRTGHTIPFRSFMFEVSCYSLQQL